MFVVRNSENNIPIKNSENRMTDGISNFSFHISFYHSYVDISAQYMFTNSINPSYHPN